MYSRILAVLCVACLWMRAYTLKHSFLPVTLSPCHILCTYTVLLFLILSFVSLILWHYFAIHTQHTEFAWFGVFFRYRILCVLLAVLFAIVRFFHWILSAAAATAANKIHDNRCAQMRFEIRIPQFAFTLTLSLCHSHSRWAVRVHLYACMASKLYNHISENVRQRVERWVIERERERGAQKTFTVRWKIRLIHQTHSFLRNYALECTKDDDDEKRQ